MEQNLKIQKFSSAHKYDQWIFEVLAVQWRKGSPFNKWHCKKLVIYMQKKNNFVPHPTLDKINLKWVTDPNIKQYYKSLRRKHRTKLS